MKKEDFTLLLTDLYQAYNPGYIEYVPQLVDRYSRMEFDAISTALIKYNRKSAPYYDPAKDTDEYVFGLMKDYSEGKRTLKGLVIDNINPQKEAVENRFVEENKKIQESVNQTIDKLKTEFSGKEKELIGAYEEKIKDLMDKISSVKPVRQSFYEGVDIQITSNYTEQEIELPNKDTFVGMGVGSRIITKTKAGKIIGLKVIDIIYDCISNTDGKPAIEIIIDKE